MNTMIRYEDFSIQMEAQAEGRFTVQVIQSPAGQTSTSPLQLPYAPGEAEGVLAALGRYRGTFAPIFTQDLSPRAVGTRLFEALFTGPVGTAFSESRGRVYGKGGLRIKLHLDLNQPDHALLANLPWELLYDPEKNEYLNLNSQTPVVRYLDVMRPEDPPPFAPPLRILVVLANPPGTDALNLEAERQKIEASWQDTQHVAVEVVQGTTLQALRARLKAQPFHVLHYSGHGTFDANTGEGVLLMEDEQGCQLKVSGDQLRVALRGTGVRLVFLNACQTAQSTKTDHLDPFAGVASALVMEGIPAVVAMQFPITDTAAITFAGEIYRQLALGVSVDEAVAEGRVAICLDDSVEWATPVLFMRSPDGTLFAPQLTPSRAPQPSARRPSSTMPSPGKQDAVEEIRQLVASDKLEQALDLLETGLKDRDEDLYNDVTSHQATLKRVKKQVRRGLISNNDESQERTRVRFAILEDLLPGVEVLS